MGTRAVSTRTGMLVVHRRSDTRKRSGDTFVSLRAAGIAFNARFVREAMVDRATRLTLLVNEEQQQLGFRFHEDEKNFDAYTLTRDGGASSRAKWIQTRTIYTEYPWLGKVLERSAVRRRFVPHYDNKEGCWLINITAKQPCKQPRKAPASEAA